jgi:DNA polymerase III epsilon subunit-like protein
MRRRLAAAAGGLRHWARRAFLLDARVPLSHLLDPGFVAIDLETTGLEPLRDAIVAVAAIPFVHGRARPGFDTLVNPGRSIPPTATAVHGIDDAAVADAESLHAVLPRLAAACGTRMLDGYDIGFDLAMLMRAASPLGADLARRVALDSRRLVKLAHPDRPDQPLEVVAAALGLDVSGRHTAPGDARMAGEILVAVLPALEALGATSVADLFRLQNASHEADRRIPPAAPRRRG